MKLKFELVNGHGVLVENRFIIDGEKYIDSINKAVHTWNMGSGIHEGKSAWCDVIIFAEKELGLDVPVFEWRDFEVEKLANEKFDFSLNKVTFIQGYKSNPAKYTEEDLRKAIELALIDAEKSVLWSVNYHIRLSNKIIECLKKYPQYVVMENNTVKELIWS